MEKSEQGVIYLILFTYLLIFNSDHSNTPTLRSFQSFLCFSAITISPKPNLYINVLSTPNQPFQNLFSDFTFVFEFQFMANSDSLPFGERYEVFISFRGADVRVKFLSHLFAALKAKQIHTFIDDDLERGKDIAGSIFRIIEESDLCLVIFSQNYAKSTWCLKELEKIHECMKKRKQIVIPVFYDVDPSDVQQLQGNYVIEFQKWRNALLEVSNLSGFDSNKSLNDAKLISAIVNDVSMKLSDIFPSNSHGIGLFGVDSRIKDVESLLCIESTNDVRMVGIWGMGGIGKTTIASKVFDKIRLKFDGHSFVSNVRETLSTKCGVKDLRDRIISELLCDKEIKLHSSHSVDVCIQRRLKRMKVLIGLDDVHSSMELKSIFEDSGLYPDLFHQGSRIIVTSRDWQVLKNVNIKSDIYEVKKLEDNEALKLFSWHAFGQNKPEEDHYILTNRVVRYANGVPLALVVLGSELRSKTTNYWEDALKKFSATSPSEIIEVLKISFYGLDRDEKNIFLDIACFFKGEKRDYVENVLGTFDFHPIVGINRLIDKSLITINQDGCIEMHDLLQQMGQEIVADGRQSRQQQSRLWTIDDMIDALTHNKATTTDVEAISIPYYFEQIDISPNAFNSMFKLRFLRIDCPVVHCPMGLDFLPYSIQYLSWVYYPLQYMPSSYNPEKLVELHLDFSNLEHINWIKPLKNLKRIYLPHCENLISISDLAMAPNLEVLHLRSCSSLTGIGSTLENLSKLTQLDLKWCKSLSYLSDFSCSIEELELSECGLRQLPSSIGLLTHLQELSLGSCERLESLPSSICNLKSLRRLNLSHCRNLNKLPENFGDLESLEELDASFSGLKELPWSTQRLKSLARLDVRGCITLSHLSEFPHSIKELVLKGSGIRQLPSTIGYLTHLKGLSMESCEKLVSIPDSICYLTSLEIIDLRGCSSLLELVPSVENMKKLTQLDVRGCRSLSHLPDFPCSVKKLHLLGSGIKQLPSRIGCLVHLKELSLDSCERLESLPSSICDLTSLETLNLSKCRNLSKLPDNLGSLESLWELHASFSGLRELPSSIKNLKRLIELDLTGCENIKSLPALPLRLQVLLAENCASVEVLLSCCKLFRIGSSIMDQPRWEAHYGSTKMPCICIDGTDLPEWMKYHNKSGSSLYLELDTRGHSINIIFCVIISSNVTPRYSLPMVVLVDQIQETCCQFSLRTPHHQFIHRTSTLVCWNFLVHKCCKNIREISFKLVDDFTGKDVDFEQSKITKCSVHLIFEKKNCRKRNHQDEDENLYL